MEGLAVTPVRAPDLGSRPEHWGGALRGPRRTAKEVLGTAEVLGLPSSVPKILGFPRLLLDSDLDLILIWLWLDLDLIRLWI